MLLFRISFKKIEEEIQVPHQKLAKIADLQAQNASRCEAFWACRSAIFATFVCDIECGPLQ